MGNKTEGTGLLNDKGEIVKEIKVNPRSKRLDMLMEQCYHDEGDVITPPVDDKGEIVSQIKVQEFFKKTKEKFRELLIKESHLMGVKPDMVLIDEFTNYQNDGIGCPTSEIKKPKANKLKRVK